VWISTLLCSSLNQMLLKFYGIANKRSDKVRVLLHSITKHSFDTTFWRGRQGEARKRKLGKNWYQWIESERWTNTKSLAVQYTCIHEYILFYLSHCKPMWDFIICHLYLTTYLVTSCKIILLYKRVVPFLLSYARKRAR